MSLIDPAKFAAFAPKALPGTLPALEAAAAKSGIADRLALAHWLGQTFVESAGFSKLEENLNYSVDGLLRTFGRHRISAPDCDRFGRKPGQSANQSAIANIIYGGTWGRENLGNTEPGDGWRYRGSGLIQTTGRDNHRAAGHENDPEKLRTDIVAAANAAANFFARHGCIGPARADDVEAVTRKVNGGLNGLTERIAATKAAKGIIL